ncbi:MAG: nitroreductase [Planctomycetaceae bacterium]
MSDLSESVSVNIRQRRTVKPKHLSSQHVEMDIIGEMLENANWAPTHGMTEPWRFTVFAGESRSEVADILVEAYQAETAPDKFKPAKLESMRTNPMRAPVLISIGMKRQESKRISELDEIQAVACAVQNMHLTAASHGLGAFWSSNVAVCSDRMKQFLGLEEDDRVLGLLYVGYPQADWPAGERTPIENKVTWRTS